jgi:hypothetical protein
MQGAARNKPYAAVGFRQSSGGQKTGAVESALRRATVLMQDQHERLPCHTRLLHFHSGYRPPSTANIRTSSRACSQLAPFIRAHRRSRDRRREIRNAESGELNRGQIIGAPALLVGDVRACPGPADAVDRRYGLLSTDIARRIGGVRGRPLRISWALARGAGSLTFGDWLRRSTAN